MTFYRTVSRGSSRYMNHHIFTAGYGCPTGWAIPTEGETWRLFPGSIEIRKTLRSLRYMGWECKRMDCGTYKLTPGKP